MKELSNFLAATFLSEALFPQPSTVKPKYPPLSPSGKNDRNLRRAFVFHGMRTMVCPGLAGYEKSFPQRLKDEPVFQDIH